MSSIITRGKYEASVMLQRRIDKAATIPSISTKRTFKRRCSPNKSSSTSQKEPISSILGTKKRREREKQEKEQITRSVIPTTLIQPEALCYNEGRNQFATDRTKARMSLSQRQRRSRELNQHLSKPQGAPLGKAEKEPSRVNFRLMSTLTLI
ncbi:hypothetical protein C5167_039786 [Papaver somniferum]|uniref:Uncharacterized protein n=1 Tax=Papaver somniferum TaxID=3469 RepID=A0A4Y7ID35_PAPSO|nr:hypothetical protein C5167_039786 [Papaver somniferum]